MLSDYHCICELKINSSIFFHFHCLYFYYPSFVVVLRYIIGTFIPSLYRHRARHNRRRRSLLRRQRQRRQRRRTRRRRRHCAASQSSKWRRREGEEASRIPKQVTFFTCGKARRSISHQFHNLHGQCPNSGWGMT